MNIENEKQELTVTNCDITGSRFKNVRAEQTTIQCCNLAGIKFNDVNLTGMDITNANLSEINIDGAQWGGAHFQYIGYNDKDDQDPAQRERKPVRFTHCSFEQGVFTDCNFANVRLDNCNISGLIINGVNIEQLLAQYVAAGEK
jgi:uncharacterized protein YjbI with pentapeptide repeats